MSEMKNSEKPDWPKPAYSWTIILFLTLAYISSFIDRYILGLLIDPIKESTGASDTMMGFQNCRLRYLCMVVSHIMDRNG